MRGSLRLAFGRIRVRKRDSLPAWQRTHPVSHGLTASAASAGAAISQAMGDQNHIEVHRCPAYAKCPASE